MTIPAHRWRHDHSCPQVEAVLRQLFRGERQGEVALVAEELAEVAPHQPGDRATVVHIARRQTAGRWLIVVVDAPGAA